MEGLTTALAFGGGPVLAGLGAPGAPRQKPGKAAVQAVVSSRAIVAGWSTPSPLLPWLMRLLSTFVSSDLVPNAPQNIEQLRSLIPLEINILQPICKSLISQELNAKY